MTPSANVWIIQLCTRGSNIDIFAGTLSLPMSSRGWPTQSTPHMMTSLASSWRQVSAILNFISFNSFDKLRTVLSEPDGVGRLCHGDERDLSQEHS